MFLFQEAGIQGNVTGEVIPQLGTGSIETPLPDAIYNCASEFVCGKHEVNNTGKTYGKIICWNWIAASDNNS